MQDIFRVRISKVTEKKSGLTVIHFPPDTPEPTSHVGFAFMEQAERIMDAHGRTMRGFVVIAFSREGVSLAHIRDRDYPEYEFMTHAKHILDNYERYSTPLDEEDELEDDNP